MLQGINLADLPLTFQNAILITRNLGYRYLWVDSLCIIQDDPDDWAFESKTMARIYSNSVLTIAALWGNDSFSGCFVERNPLVTEDCRIGKWKYGDVFIRSSDRRCGQTLGLVEPEPLLERAWVLQERFLSPRTLYYGPWELLWECGARTASETEPEGASMDELWAEGTLKKRFRDMEGALDSESDDPFFKPGLRDIYIIWREIRALYWSSQLTHHSDSLVAIAGITSRMEQSTSLHFVSGLCKEFLYSELLWEVRNASETSRSTLSQTWSWASVKGAKGFSSIYDSVMYSKASNFHIRVEAFDDPSDLYAHRHLNGLHIRGPLLRATLERDEHGRFVTHSDRLPKYGYEADIPLEEKIEVFCLVIVEWRPRSEEDPIGTPHYAGLILMPSVDKVSAYERVGVWNHQTYMGPSNLVLKPGDWDSIQLV
ncbi:MAG: hypothetical protein LQ346_006674 [Caloplaca aetnensis]|nr:MAG: hypothetical protein LQ346_006674 [Caloplaca aetnensis]